MKHLLKNSPKRKHEYRNICEIPLPKSPVITRWGTWLAASHYYYDNFDKICKFIKGMTTKNNDTIIRLKQLTENTDLKKELAKLSPFKKKDFLLKNNCQLLII